MPQRTMSRPTTSRRTTMIAAFGIGLAVIVGFSLFSLSAGGHVAGPTHIEPGNIGLVLDTYTGDLEPKYMAAGTHYNGPWETVIEVPTMQRTISLTNTDKDSAGNVEARAVEVNTPTNMLTVDVSCQYHIDPDKADDLWRKFHEQFENLDEFEAIQLEPAVKEAVNYSMGDMDTMKALTTAGKQETEQQALKLLNDEWEPQGIIFSNFMVRGVEQDEETKKLLSSTLAMQQQISNAQLALQQQRIDNETLLQQARADAKINQLQNSTLTDLYIQDQELGQVKKMYLPSKDLMGLLNK